MLQTITPDESLKKICTEAGIPFFSATEAFLLQCENQPLYYTYDRHFTPQGHEFFAHQLQLLFQKQFLDNKDNWSLFGQHLSLPVKISWTLLVVFFLFPLPVWNHLQFFHSRRTMNIRPSTGLVFFWQGVEKTYNTFGSVSNISQNMSNTIGSISRRYWRIYFLNSHLWHPSRLPCRNGTYSFCRIQC